MTILYPLDLSMQIHKIPTKYSKKIKELTMIAAILSIIHTTSQQYAMAQDANTNIPCFQSEYAPDNTILDSILLIQVLPTSDQDKETIIGTGFVIDGPRIMTARHIFHHGVYKIKIYNRYGQFLGLASPDFDPNAPTSPQATNEILHDTVTLHIINNNDDSNNPLNNLTPIIYTPHNNIGAMSVSIPFGIAGGASGAPVLDAYGNAIGVVSAATISNKTINASGNYPAVLYGINNNTAFPPSTFAFIAPILGNNIPIPNVGTVIIPAYPEGHCVIYKAALIPMPSNRNITMHHELTPPG